MFHRRGAKNAEVRKELSFALSLRSLRGEKMMQYLPVVSLRSAQHLWIFGSISLHQLHPHHFSSHLTINDQ